MDAWCAFMRVHLYTHRGPCSRARTRARAHTKTGKSPAVRQLHAHSHTQAQSRAKVTHAQTNTLNRSEPAAHSHVHPHTHTRTHTHATRTRTRARACAGARTHKRARAPAQFFALTRTGGSRSCVRTSARTHIPLTRTGGARCGGWARAFRRRVTPLHAAAENGHATVVAALLAHGAGVDAKDDRGCMLPVVCFLTHTRMHGWMPVVCTCGCNVLCVWGRACMCPHARTRRIAHHPQSDNRTHPHTHERSRIHARGIFVSFRTLARADRHAHKQSHAHKDSLAAGWALTCTPAHAHARAAVRRARTHTRTHAHARLRTRTFPLTRTDGSLCGVCASAIRRRFTPLHRAAINGHADVVAALLAHGADVHAKDKDGCVLPVVCSLTHTRMMDACRAYVCVKLYMRMGPRAGVCAQTHIHARTFQLTRADARTLRCVGERDPPQVHAAPLGRWQRARGRGGGAARARRRRGCEGQTWVRVAGRCFWATVGARRAGRGRPGRTGSISAKVNANTTRSMRAHTQPHTCTHRDSCT
jgi:hypothetical protein